MKDKLSPKVVATLAAAAVTVVALIGWFGFVAPQRSQASSLDGQIQETQTQLVVAKAAAEPVRQAKAGASRRALKRAMPQRVAMPSILRQILHASQQSGVRLDSVTPQAVTPLQGYDTVPMDIVVAGRYFPIQHFLHRLRMQTRVAPNGVHSSGRLFSVETLNLAADENLPRLTATIHVNAFVYGKNPSMPATAPSTSLPSSTTTAAEGMSQ